MSDSDWLISRADGLRARKAGQWAHEKLSFLDEFIPAALQATGVAKHPDKKPKLQRWYVDLFAGPGRNVVERTGEEFAGSAIRVLPMGATRNPNVHFTHAVLVNKNKDDHAALEARVSRLRAEGRCPIPEKNLQQPRHDANWLLGGLMPRIHSQAYVFVFADITKPSHWPWSSVRKLRHFGHQSVDLYMLFPLGMAIQRILSFNPATVEQGRDVLDSFFGTKEWRELHDRRITDAQSPELHRRILDLYSRRLKELGWAYVYDTRDVKRTGNVGLYHMLFASNHEAGAAIAQWSAKKRQRATQHSFDGF
jgi:three-Cys-motif partner protein